MYLEWAWAGRGGALGSSAAAGETRGAARHYFACTHASAPQHEHFKAMHLVHVTLSKPSGSPEVGLRDEAASCLCACIIVVDRPMMSMLVDERRCLPWLLGSSVLILMSGILGPVRKLSCSCMASMRHAASLRSAARPSLDEKRSSTDARGSPTRILHGSTPSTPCTTSSSRLPSSAKSRYYTP